MKNWFEDIKKYYLNGLWNIEMVRNAVSKGKITEAQYQEIVGQADAVTTK